MSGANFADLETYGLLKEIYSEDVEYQDAILASFYNFLRKASDGEVNFDGNYFNIGAQFQINESYKSIVDGERLPDPDYPKGVFAKYRPKLSYSSLEMTTFAATRGHKGGRPDGKFLEETIKGTLLSFMSNLDFDCLANGRGYRGTVAAATPGASNFTVNFSMRIRAGMRFDWYDSTYAVKRGSIKVDLRNVDRLNRTVYIDPSFGTGAVPAGATANDVLVVYGALAAGEPSDGRYAAGYDRVCDNSLSLGQLSPSQYALWAATVFNAGGANPNQEILQQLHDALYTLNNAYPNKFSFNSNWKRGYLAPFLNQRHFTSNSYDTGASSLTWSPVRMGKDEAKKKIPTMEMLEDKNHDPTKVNMWIDDAICIATDYSSTPALADEDGAELRYRQNFDSMHGFYRFWWNTVVKRRNGLGQITGFSTVAGVI